MNPNIIKLYRNNISKLLNPAKSYNYHDVIDAFSNESTLLNSIGDGINILTPDLEVTNINFTLKSWFPDRSSFIGKRCFYVYHNRMSPCEHCPVLRTLEDGTAHHDIVPFKNRTSNVRGWHELQSFPVLDNGKVVGVIEYVQDITYKLELYSKLDGIENKMSHFKKQNELLKTHLDNLTCEKETLANDINLNIRRYINPLIKQIKEIADEAPIQYDLISFLETMLQDIVKPYAEDSAILDDFTSKEIQVMSLVRAGKLTKEIASAMHVSTKTIDFHRANIRKKLQLKRSDCLRTHVTRINIPLD